MNKFKKCMALVLTGAMAFSLLAGCGGDGETQVATAGGNGSTSGQQINLRAISFGNNYDVQDMGWRWMMAECYEGLMRDVADENGDKFEFAGAESMDVSDDGLVYTFHLRENAKWSDGKPVTAHDYEYGWKRLLNPENAYDYASFIFNVVGAEEYYNGTGSVDDVAIKAVDDYTFEVTLKVADPTFQAKLVATPLYPTREDIAEAAGDNWGKDWTLCVYNGPFAMTGLVEDNSMTWTKNEYYWNAENVKLDQINWYCVPENATAATMFDNGQLDVLDASGEYIAKYSKKAENGELQSMDVEYPGAGMLCFDHQNGGLSGLMKNVNIRKAISYSINREEMVSAVYGRYSAAYGLVSPAITLDGKSYRSQAGDIIKTEYDSYAGDSAKLKELFQKGLDELGVKTPMSDVKLTLLSYGSTTENQLEREYIQQSLQQNLGIKVELNTVGDYDMFMAKRDTFDFDIFISTWFSDYNDPMDFLKILTTGTYSSYGLYSNPEYDAMANSLTGVQDNAVRLETYKNMENKLLVEDCAVAPIYYADKHYYYQNWVQDFRTSSFGASQELYIAYIDGK
ncbi:MAG TPA: peptide ABC transporter substrate-binding protein [Candidatus Butyricicoccus avistercoris]|uniref:Peptide ABC transporter substrate-binding protein n=1 Tax=Candidatus Butyricicoccus avistercoris TaxID=2838518 RepID=A0A9D1TJL2_9FIRM|nr:peptide ABC transporter substrate-binding protein [Candidatus Butyricicoccus avistercoris]